MNVQEGSTAASTELTKKIAYLERKLSRLQEHQKHQEKLEDLNRLLLKNALQELERSRKAAETANQAKTDFLANMSHEIRTPLNIVLGMSELLENTELNPTQKQFVEKGRAAGQHLLELINNILEFSRIEKGKVTLSVQPFDLNNLAQNLAAIFQTICEQRGLDFSLEYEVESDVLLWGDEPKIRQILLNLLTNAAKFTDEGFIRLVVCNKDGNANGIQFVIEDSGIGLSSDDLEQIFERFNQVESALTKSRQGGVGLGLAIVKLLIQKMGGTIEVDSARGRGSTFTITLPLSKVEVDTRKITTKTTNHGETENLQNLSLLVVDDVAGNLYVVEHFLEGLSLSVTYCSGGRQAVEQYKRDRFDVVLMDICMPDIDGVEALKLIRSHEQTACLQPSCMIAMTAHAFQEIRADLQEQGFNAILTKPFSRDDLLTTLKRRNNLPTFIHPPIESAEIAVDTDSGADVRIPSSLMPLIPVLLEKLNREHATIVKAVERSDFANVSRLCHANKGVVGMYGFNKLSSMYHGLEQAAQNEALGLRTMELEELTGYLSNLSSQYGYRHNESVE